MKSWPILDLSSLKQKLCLISMAFILLPVTKIYLLTFLINFGMWLLYFGVIIIESWSNDFQYNLQ